MNSNIEHLDRLKYPRTSLRSRSQVIDEIEILLADIRKNVHTGLHLGAGSSKIPGLINCDLFNPEADLKADATNLSMFDDGTVDLIESHHMIEHLSFKDADLALTEWNRVLRTKGLLTLTFPDTVAISLRYIKHSLLYPLFPRPKRLDYIVKMLVGSQEHEGMFHKNAFDKRSMSRILDKHGFKVEFTYHPFPIRPTPSRLVIARKVT
jgi:predicted SAM-dependent methyltransferase